jgi:hypothetical protein
MRRRTVTIAVSIVVALLGCTHDFSVFEGTARPSDASTKDSANDTTPSDGSVPCTDPGGATFMGHCYFSVQPIMTWDRAKTSCESASAHLVTITSPDEQSFVAGVDASNPHWIGLSRPDAAPPTDPASFSWITGEPSTFGAWQSGEPNGDGACVRMSGGTWDDWTCPGGFYAMCERE